MADVADPILLRIEELRRRRQELDEMDLVAPEPPELDTRRLNLGVRPVTASSLKPLPAPISIEMLKQLLRIKLHEYISGDSQDVLLIKAPPGTGKTHITVEVVQFYARHGKRGLWAASRHNMFDEMPVNYEHFDSPLWYHWQGLGREVDGVPMCRHADAQAKWAILGYTPFDLCRQLCMRDGHMSICPYRQQEKRKEPLIFAQHQHLTSGLSISDYDFCIIDELPLQAFYEERRIPVDALAVAATGPLAELISILSETCHYAEVRRRISGKALLDRIGPVLDDVYAQVDLGIGAQPVIPQVYDAYQVADAPYWYVLPFLELVMGEHKMWKDGKPEWNERVWLTRSGLHMLTRVEPWEKLPAKIIVLDATAEPELYELILRRKCQVYAPVVEHVGRVYQIAGRLNGKSTTIHDDDLTSAGREMIEIVKYMGKGSDIGVVCWKAVYPHFSREFGNDRVMTYGGARGSNRLQHVERLFVCGTFSPDHYQLIDIASALCDDLSPFFAIDEKGNRQPLYTHGDREFRLTAEGLARAREMFGPETAGLVRRVGYYAHPVLDAIHRQLVLAEIVQVIHRARINIRFAEVTVLTSTPTDEPMDGVWNDPPIGPPEINWRIWLRLEPWLLAQYEAGETLTYDNLAEAAGVQPIWAKRNKWLDVIVNYMPDKWQTGSAIPVGRGRPGRCILPLMARSVNSRPDELIDLPIKLRS